MTFLIVLSRTGEALTALSPERSFAKHGVYQNPSARSGQLDTDAWSTTMRRTDDPSRAPTTLSCTEPGTGRRGNSVNVTAPKALATVTRIRFRVLIYSVS